MLKKLSEILGFTGVERMETVYQLLDRLAESIKSPDSRSMTLQHLENVRTALRQVEFETLKPNVAEFYALRDAVEKIGMNVFGTQPKFGVVRTNLYTEQCIRSILNDEELPKTTMYRYRALVSDFLRENFMDELVAWHGLKGNTNVTSQIGVPGMKQVLNRLISENRLVLRWCCVNVNNGSTSTSKRRT
jgi:hypothetical protein